MPLKFIKSIRGNNKLVSKEFIYVKDKNGDNKIMWKCEYFKSKMCKARVHTSNDKVICSINRHNHRADLAKVLADTAVNLLERKAAETTKSPYAIIAEVSKDIHIAVASKLPSINQLKKTTNRIKRNMSEHPPNPDKVNNFIIPNKYTKTNDNQQFLIYDSGMFLILIYSFLWVSIFNIFFI